MQRHNQACLELDRRSGVLTTLIIIVNAKSKNMMTVLDFLFCFISI